MPLRIDGELIKEARVTGHVFHRSIPQQIEHWATLGKVIEAVLTVPSVAKVKALKAVDLDRALSRARSLAGKKQTLALLAKKKGPLYGVKPVQPNVLLQYHSNGTSIQGEIVGGKFVTTKKRSNSKVAAAR